MIPMLNGTNYVTWKENVEIVLGCMDLDLALRKEQPIPTTDDPKTDHIEKWERSNRCDSFVYTSIAFGLQGIDTYTPRLLSINFQGIWAIFQEF
ncbi:hypothetical protein AgCh_029528 [Apium graveolens]